MFDWAWLELHLPHGKYRLVDETEPAGVFVDGYVQELLAEAHNLRVLKLHLPESLTIVFRLRPLSETSHILTSTN